MTAPSKKFEAQGKCSQSNQTRRSILSTLLGTSRQLEWGGREKSAMRPCETQEAGPLDLLEVHDMGDYGACLHAAEEHKLSKIMTEFPTVDEALKGGYGRGELLAVVAGPDGAETSFLLSLTYSAVRQNQRVLYYTVENKWWELAQRMRTMTMQCSKENLRGTIEDPGRGITACNNQHTGTVHFVQLIPNFHSALDIKAQFNRYKDMHGMPGVLVIDRMDHLKSHIRRDNKLLQLEDTYAELSALAGSEGVPIIVASQVNKEEAKREAVSMAGISNIILTLTSREQQPYCKSVYVEKSRTDQSGQLALLRLDLDSQAMEEEHRPSSR